MNDSTNAMLEKIKNGTFNGKIRMKVVDPNYMQEMEPVGDFITKWFNNFYTELSIFSEYFSVQEHTNRAKFSEFCEQKIFDISKFYLTVKTLAMYPHIKLYQKPKLEHFVYHKNIVGIADYFAMLHQNMKTCFVPESDITAALQSRFENTMNLKEEEEITENLEEYKELERYMKILLLQENINEKFMEAKVVKGFLELKSATLFFKLKLSGNSLENAYWQFENVETNSTVADNYILQAFSNLKQTLLSKLIEFIVFYENKVLAQKVKTKLENVSGTPTHFSGIFKNNSYSAIFNDKKILEVFNHTAYGKEQIHDINTEFL